MKIAILGAGAFGTALGGILAFNGYDIDYYDPKLERESLSEVLAGASYILLAAPSSAAPYLLPHLPTDTPLIVATKGILGDASFHEFSDYMVLSGPGFADDIKARKKTILTITDKRLEELFRAEYMSFDYTADAKGVLMCGALKNVYALLSGYRGLKPGTPEFSKYVREATLEMKEFLKVNGADEATVELACGKGDLKLTCYLPSRNYEFGKLFSENSSAKPEKTVEGLAALRRILRGEIKVPENLPIFTEIVEKFTAISDAL
ncbi:hypothetical protein IJH23_00665 [Candidatus Saccharibacteria bacterium]|nr:hypothetical protein [Candidatus Saccharibacteria bacterium]